MKVKIIIIALMAVISLVSCSKDGSTTIQLDEFSSVVPADEWHTLEECKKTSKLFSLVPGEYPISWKVNVEMPQATNYAATMVIKLRLNNKISVKDEWIKKGHPTFAPSFSLIDANGKEINSWLIAYNAEVAGSDYCTEKDLFMDFVKFLQSEPGTEMEVTLGTYIVQSVRDELDEVKNAKGIIMKVHTDSQFEKTVAEIMN